MSNARRCDYFAGSPAEPAGRQGGHVSDRLTDSQITEGLRLAGEATPGPWSVSDYAAYIFGPQDAMVADDCPHCAGFRIRGYGGKLPQEQNAKWIAHAGTHYAAALAEVQALRGQVKAATDECDRILKIYSSPLVGEDEAKRIYGIVEKIRGKVSR